MSKPNSFSYRVYYEDTDAGGIVYYANHLRFFERARTDLLRSLNISQSELVEKEGIIFVVRRCEIDYLSPAKLDDILEITAEVKKISATSISMLQEAQKSGVVLSRLNVDLVCVDKVKLRPKKIPENIKNLLNV